MAYIEVHVLGYSTYAHNEIVLRFVNLFIITRVYYK